MESEKNSVPEQRSPYDSYSPSSQLPETEYIRNDFKNILEEKFFSVGSDSNVNVETYTNVAGNDSNSPESKSDNSSTTTENSIHSELLRPSLQTELSLDDKVCETSCDEHSRECQTPKEETLVCTAEEESVEIDDFLKSAGGSNNMKALFPEGGIITNYKSEHSNEDEMEEGELKDATPSPKQSPPHIFPFYGTGNCRWGDSCRYLHPNAGDKGNYCMFSPVRLPPVPPILQNCFKERFVPCFYGPSFLLPEKLNPLPLRPVSINETSPECPWERDLKHIKELLIKSKKMKERETNFREKQRTSGSDENYEMNKYHYKNQIFKYNPHKRNNEVCGSCKRVNNVSGTSHHEESESLRKNRYKQLKPVWKLRGLCETDKRDEIPTKTERVLIGNYAMNKHFGLYIQSAHPRVVGQSDISRRSKYQKTFRSTSCSSRSSLTDADSPELKRSLDGMEIASPKTKAKTRQTLSVLGSEKYSTINNKYNSSKLASKSQSLSLHYHYSKSGKTSGVSYVKDNANQATLNKAKRLRQKSCCENFPSSAKGQGTKNDNHKIKPKCSTTSSYSLSGCRVSLEQRKLSHCPNAVPSFHNLSSKPLPTTRTCTTLSPAEGYSKSLSSHFPSKSHLSRCFSHSGSPSMSSVSSVCSSTSSSSSDSTVSNHSERRVSHRFRGEMEHLMQYSTHLCSKKIPPGAAKGKHAVRHSKQEMPKMASMGETPSHCSTRKNLKNSPRQKDYVRELSKKVGPAVKRHQEIKELKWSKDMAFRRDALKLNSAGAQLVLSATCEPTVNCIIREPRSRKEKLILLLKAIEEAIDRKRDVSKRNEKVSK